MAWQLNFTDSIHLSKAFKKAYGKTIMEVRGAGQVNCEEF
ncbi:hypothetical protein PEDI_23600 [Persicobacter diffluens]|uniref:HTH araC/xylS-type domain-containing protein n=1 Tax=Persicobacter diffluens TaxID=981 RepID=A0AAN4VY18_9BACT|nr:hypothetical protein PEDI_23600 [Persicobacter diffluens]